MEEVGYSEHRSLGGGLGNGETGEGNWKGDGSGLNNNNDKSGKSVKLPCLESSSSRVDSAAPLACQTVPSDSASFVVDDHNDERQRSAPRVIEKNTIPKKVPRYESDHRLRALNNQVRRLHLSDAEVEAGNTGRSRGDGASPASPRDQWSGQTSNGKEGQDAKKKYVKDRLNFADGNIINCRRLEHTKADIRPADDLALFANVADSAEGGYGNQFQYSLTGCRNKMIKGFEGSQKTYRHQNVSGKDSQAGACNTLTLSTRSSPTVLSPRVPYIDNNDTFCRSGKKSPRCRIIDEKGTRIYRKSTVKYNIEDEERNSLKPVSRKSSGLLSPSNSPLNSECKIPEKVHSAVENTKKSTEKINSLTFDYEKVSETTIRFEKEGRVAVGKKGSALHLEGRFQLNSSNIGAELKMKNCTVVLPSRNQMFLREKNGTIKTEKNSGAVGVHLPNERQTGVGNQPKSILRVLPRIELAAKESFSVDSDPTFRGLISHSSRLATLSTINRNQSIIKLCRNSSSHSIPKSRLKRQQTKQAPSNQAILAYKYEEENNSFLNVCVSSINSYFNEANGEKFKQCLDKSPDNRSFPDTTTGRTSALSEEEVEYGKKQISDSAPRVRSNSEEAKSTKRRKSGKFKFIVQSKLNQPTSHDGVKSRRDFKVEELRVFVKEIMRTTCDGQRYGSIKTKQKTASGETTADDDPSSQEDCGLLDPANSRGEEQKCPAAEGSGLLIPRLRLDMQPQQPPSGADDHGGDGGACEGDGSGGGEQGTPPAPPSTSLPPQGGDEGVTPLLSSSYRRGGIAPEDKMLQVILAQRRKSIENNASLATSPASASKVVLPGITKCDASPGPTPRNPAHNPDGCCYSKVVSEPSTASYDLLSWGKNTNKKRAKSRWMLIGFGQSVEVKADEEEEDDEDGQMRSAGAGKHEPTVTLDSFYDPICNLGIGRKGGLIQYLRMVGQEAKWNKGLEHNFHSGEGSRKDGGKKGNAISSTSRENAVRPLDNGMALS